MRLRTQLMLAAFFLAIIPLAAIVVYSYDASHQALQAAYRRQAERLTKQMDARLESIRGELDAGLAGVSALPVENVQNASSTSAPHPPVSEIVVAMGDAAPLVDAVSFEPAHPAPPAPAAKPAQTLPTRPPKKFDVTAAPSSVPHEYRVETNFTAPVVVQLPQVPKFVMPAETAGKISELRGLSRQLAENNATMSADDREALRVKMRDLNEQIQKEVAASNKDFSEKLNAALAARTMAIEQRRAMRQLQKAQEKWQQKPADPNGNVSVDNTPAPPPPVVATPAPAPEPAAAASKDDDTAAERAADAEEKRVEAQQARDEQAAEMRERSRRAALILGRDVGMPLQTSGGQVVGRVTAQIKPDAVIRRVLGAPVDDSEAAFAVDREGHLYTRSDAERQTIERLNVVDAVAHGRQPNVPGWLVVTSNVGGNGLRVGVARKVGDEFEELRNTAARNFGLGLGLVVLALIGVVPVANHISRDVNLIAAGAERVAAGDLQTRVPVHSKNEFGQLASAFNRMAHDLSEQRQKLFEEERARREQEVQQRILERKAAELEEARRFQLSLLPKEVPSVPGLQVAAFTQTATEVGGDYYDFHVDDALTVAIGDATGHGAKAGTMVTVIKTLFSAYTGDAPRAFLGRADDNIKRMELGRMAMALSLARVTTEKLVVASAGMPPVLVHRAATSQVEELAIEATPLGTIGSVYDQTEGALSPGDTILFMTDGLPELTNAAGAQLGYSATLEAFAKVAAGDVQSVIRGLVDAAHAWHGDQPPNDDMTFVVVRVA